MIEEPGGGSNCSSVGLMSWIKKPKDKGNERCEMKRDVDRDWGGRQYDRGSRQCGLVGGRRSGRRRVLLKQRRGRRSREDGGRGVREGRSWGSTARRGGRDEGEGGCGGRRRGR